MPARFSGNAFRAPGCHQSRLAPFVANSIVAIECGGNVTVHRPARESSTTRRRGDTRSGLAGSLPASGDSAVSSRLDETIPAARMLTVTARRYSLFMRVTAALPGRPEAVALREGPPNAPAESAVTSTCNASAPMCGRAFPLDKAVRQTDLDRPAIECSIPFPAWRSIRWRRTDRHSGGRAPGLPPALST